MNKNSRSPLTLGLIFIVIGIWAIVVTYLSIDDETVQLTILGENVPASERTLRSMWLPLSVESIFVFCGIFLVVVGIKQRKQ